MSTFKAKIKGIAPLLMHNERLANPRDPLTRELKKLTGDRGKTDESLDEIMRVEWRGGLYEDDGRVCVPAANIIAAIKEGAAQAKLGKKVKAAVFSVEPMFPLEYTGPKDIEALFEDNRFVDYRCVGVNNKKIMRTRPIFRDWSLDIKLEFDAEIIESSQLEHALAKAGTLSGIGDHRPQYGRFVVV